MNIQVISTAIFIAFGFVGWTIIGSYSRACGSWIGTIVMLSTAAAVALLSSKQLINVVAPNGKAWILLLVAGVINGVAVYLYSNKIADITVPTAAFVVTVSILMVVIAPFLNWLINGAVPNYHQTLGFGFAAIAIYFLSK